MKCQIEKEPLLQAVVTASRLATTRATLPILQNLYLEAGKLGLIIRSTDLEQTLEVEVKALVEQEGKVTIPARLLSDYLHNNSDNSLTLTLNDLTLEVRSANHQAQLIGLPAEDYPNLPATKLESTLKLSGLVIKELITKTLFAASLSDTQPILNSLLWRFTKKNLTIVGTDGYRLGYYRTTSNQEIEADYIIPRRSLQELERLINDQEVEITFTSAQVRFKVGNCYLTSRILDGAFPAYEAIIPKGFIEGSKPKSVTAVNLSSQALLQSLKLASLFSRDSAYSTKLTFEANKLVISAISPQVGENSSEIALDAPIDQPTVVSLNAQYLIDVLPTMTGDITISLIDRDSPVVLTSDRYKGYLYLVMPLRSE